MQIKTYDRTKTKTKKKYIYTKGHLKGDKIERTEEIKENQGSKAVWWPAAVIIENALPRTIARAILWNSHINSLWSPPLASQQAVNSVQQ